MGYRYRIILFGVLLFVFAGCEERPIDRPIDPEGRVLLLYDNINDHPYKPFTGNVAAAGRAVAAGALKKQNHRVIVYQRGWREDAQSDARNTIYELVQDKGTKTGFRIKVLKQYAQGEYNNVRPATINAIVDDVRDLVPAGHYGIAFGSHGLGWIPKSNTVEISRNVAAEGAGSYDFLWDHSFENDQTRFLMGYNEKLDVDEFLDALDDWEWDFLLLDDCFMASIEALYDLRSLADYIISSPTEIMLEGFPYDRVVTRLFAGWESGIESALTAVSQSFVDYYKNYTTSPYATISLVKTSKLDALKDAVRNVYHDARFNSSLDPVAAKVQYYEGMVQPGHVFWDLDHYLISASTNAELVAEFRARLDEAVVWRGHTDSFFSMYGGDTYPTVTHFSGLSTFINYPTVSQQFFPEYQQTEWYKETN